MSDRLKDIWGAFERKTSRRLSGGGVDHIPAPARRHSLEADVQSMPSSFEDPPDAAMAARRAQLPATQKEQPRTATRRRRGPAGVGDAPSQSDYWSPDGVPAGPLSASASIDFAGSHGAPAEAVDMIRGLRDTQFRTERPAADYSAFRQSNDARRAGRKRKKFLGLF